MSADRPAAPSAGALQVLAEMREFATFTAAEQRYIRRSLDVSMIGSQAAEHWARGIEETANIRQQSKVYGVIEAIRLRLTWDFELDDASSVLPALIKISAFDLDNGKLTSFGAYRFLYERLLGAAVRPWLLSAFTAAASLPCIHPELRAELIGSLTDRQIKEAGWSNREAAFIPEWIEKVPLRVS